MTASLTILETIGALLLVMAAGFGARRGGVLSDEATLGLGRIVADVTFPVLCFKGLVDAGGAALAEGWVVPVLGFATLALSTGVGAALAPVFCGAASSRPTFTFCVAIGNWIFLPLPIAQALYGRPGTTAVLLHNAGAQVFLWTFGIFTLRGGRLGREALVGIARNPGLWATGAGVLVAMKGASIGRTGVEFASASRMIATALGMLGGLTIPLVTLTIGAQLAGRAEVRGNGSLRAVAGVVLGRMLVAPAVVIAAVAAVAARWPTSLNEPTRMTEYIIAAMPVSLSVGALVQRCGGDVALASRSIAVTTVASVALVPLLHRAAVSLGL